MTRNGRNQHPVLLGQGQCLRVALRTGQTPACYSENQGATYATKAIVPQSAALTQNMNITHLKTQGIGQHTRHTGGPIGECTVKIHGAKIDGTNAQCGLAMGSGGYAQWRLVAVGGWRLVVPWGGP